VRLVTELILPLDVDIHRVEAAVHRERLAQYRALMAATS
jgi:hypothetical protein